MIEILNKKSDAVVNKHQNNIATITFQNGARVAFTGKAAEMCGLRIGYKVNFIVLNKRVWCFYVDKSQDGYSIFSINSKQMGVGINAKSIIALFHERTRYDLPARFYIQERGSEYQGKKLFEILTHKPLNEVGK